MQNQRHLFTLPENTHYLNCAYKAPLLIQAEAAAMKALNVAHEPQFYAPEHYFDRSEEARTLFSQIVGCRPSEVAVVASASYGLASALANVACRAGQHALTIDKEFPSGHLSLQRWCHTHSAELNVVSPLHQDEQAEEWNDRIVDQITEATAVVLLSSIHWMNGIKFDLERIGEKCSAVGAKFIVDGTQSVGALPMDVKKFKIDALVCAAYKWLLGPYSTGLAYMGEAFNEGIPLEETWMNRTNAMHFSDLTNYDPVYKPDAGRYNVGESANFILMPMLCEGLRQVNEWTPEAVQNYAGELIKPLLDYQENQGLRTENPAYVSNHLFALNLPANADPTKLKEELAEKRIYVSVRGTSLRVSVNLFNTDEDVEKLISALRNA